MASLTFSQVAFTCKDPIATEIFYAKNFGFKRARVAKLPDGGQIVFIKMSDYPFYFELFKAKEELPIAPPINDGPEYPSVRHLAFKVDNVDAKLAEMGDDAKITLGPFNFDEYIPGWRTVWVADPDGRIIEISQGFVDQDNPPPLEADLRLPAFTI
ncbi:MULTISPECIES: VOC family protein [unclassified Nostoc]|uniref:VOC family protein n=1 Tax=unclassified Nostoc TaxID=2593658 RepID=UPI0025AA537A|nr:MULTISPECIES: VOC family protein [unclassified Nostoc]MDM9584030.1 VOC family protein [Nostoc sp. GT001]MDZ7943662.1 VOC family protein [Nostoc sp. EfeVER01]MDZ7991669.1 VOC family protein [Nostoc sp. EspVER01]